MKSNIRAVGAQTMLNIFIMFGSATFRFKSEVASARAPKISVSIRKDAAQSCTKEQALQEAALQGKVACDSGQESGGDTSTRRQEC